LVRGKREGTVHPIDLRAPVHMLEVEDAKPTTPTCKQLVVRRHAYGP
jgi:hypothetical protein